jgi:hypothetical protein
MSASAPKADICGAAAQVCFGPEAEERNVLRFFFSFFIWHLEIHPGMHRFTKVRGGAQYFSRQYLSQFANRFCAEVVKLPSRNIVAIKASSRMVASDGSPRAFGW